ncbi:putative glutathione S-transferase 6 [Glandiceps talaboti]
MGCGDSKSTSVESSNKPTDQKNAASDKPKIVLYYFNFRARAEVIRLILHYGGVPFEDKRITFEEWGEMTKNNAYRGPLGQLPYAELDGEVICQTAALVRLAARKVGICGENDWETAKADSLVDTEQEALLKVGSAYLGPEGEREEKLKEIATNIIPGYLARMEKTLESNDGGNGFFVGKKITHADFMVYSKMDTVINIAKMHGKDSVLDSYPLLKAHYTKMSALPQLQEYLKNRPDAPF